METPPGNPRETASLETNTQMIRRLLGASVAGYPKLKDALVKFYITVQTPNANTPSITIKNTEMEAHKHFVQMVMVLEPGTKITFSVGTQKLASCTVS